jgi:hypothetical protein
MMPDGGRRHRVGSLTGVFPFLEAVKEYKDLVEAAIAIQNRWE